MYEYEAVVRRIIDADSIVVDVDHGCDIWQHNVHVRLAGIDAPERWTLPGKAARDFVMALVPQGMTVVVASESYNPNDKYGRMLVTMLLPSGSTLQELLLAAGHAVPYFGGAR